MQKNNAHAPNFNAGAGSTGHAVRNLHRSAQAAGWPFFLIAPGKHAALQAEGG
jgi:hypothetical protein